MQLSGHNILSRLHQSEDYFLVNVLSGNADILTPQEVQRIMNGEVIHDPEYVSKGYVVDPTEESRKFRGKYLDFLDARETDEVQLFYVPTYACNFDCFYCYQDSYSNQTGQSAVKIADAFFRYVQEHFRDRRKYVTLFGGEPLLSNEHNKEFLEYFVDRCRDFGLDLAVVTNGYNLDEFIPLLLQTRIREIQVTLDGPERVHNIRRPLKGGQGTFDRIVRGIDAALGSKLPVNLRVVLDRDNIAALPDLASFAMVKGWTSSPLFKTQLGRNYELHQCQSQQDRLYTRIDLYRDLYALIRENPRILEFHKPAFSVSKFLFENGELPAPLFDSCPGCKTEWAFDYTGRIYSCTATVGKPGEELGMFYPQLEWNKEKIETWQQRDVLSIKACTTCNLRLACGGGCASVAFNREKALHAPDCRPVKELMELGIALYSAVNGER